MKAKYIWLIIAFVIMSCDNNLASWIVSDVTNYSNCTTNKEFQEWLYSINPDGKTIEKDGVKYNVHNGYDPLTGIPEIRIEIVDGIAEYYKKEFLSEMVSQIETDLKNQSLVLSVYSECDWVIINLKNEQGFNNIN
ncbi:hypothetical protein [Prevotella sp. oral taxon 299]|uniref:hypothetical protein n=1 Tax=Prevotella sp. oral taxon 299 TaxID=652716 RepID=UPI0012EB6D63|nr:hypothetical protein [Prevotella sp. oral taxon 299]